MAIRGGAAVAAALLLFSRTARAEGEAAPEAPTPAGEEGNASPILEALRSFLVGFEFHWGTLSDPMKSKLHPSATAAAPAVRESPLKQLEEKMEEFRQAAKLPPGPSREERLRSVQADCDEVEKGIFRSLPAALKRQALEWRQERIQTLTQVSRVDIVTATQLFGQMKDSLKQAREHFEAGRYGECQGCLNTAKAALPPVYVQVLQGHPPIRDEVNQALRERARLEERNEARRSFPRQLLKIDGVMQGARTTVVVIASQSFEIGDDLGALDPQLEGSFIIKAGANGIVVKYKGEEIPIPVGGSGF